MIKTTFIIFLFSFMILDERICLFFFLYNYYYINIFSFFLKIKINLKKYILIAYANLLNFIFSFDFIQFNDLIKIEITIFLSLLIISFYCVLLGVELETRKFYSFRNIFGFYSFDSENLLIMNEIHDKYKSS